MFQNHICNRVTNAIQAHLENAAITLIVWSRSPLNFTIHLPRLRVSLRHWATDECAGSPFPPYSDSDMSFPPHIRCQVTLPRAPGPVKCHSVSSAVSQSQPGSDGINKSAPDKRSEKEHVINAMALSSCQKQSYPQCCHCLPNPARAKPWSMVS